VGVVERTDELLKLRDLRNAARSGDGNVIVVEGAAGAGKTSLLQVFAARETAAGTVFLSAAASPAEGDLPLSTIGQLFADPALSPAEAEQAERLLHDGALTATAYGLVTGDPVPVPIPVFERLSAILLQVADRVPVVVAIDDIHHADVASLQFLCHLADQARPARLTLVLTECLRLDEDRAGPCRDLLRHPRARRLRLRLLPEDGVAGMLAAQYDGRAARRLAADCWQASGGNPLLVRAILEDQRGMGTARPDSLVFGDAFRQAVLTCLYRSGVTVPAEVLAVLPARTPAALHTELSALDFGAVGAARDVLRATGLAGKYGFRHDAVAGAVLSGMRPTARTDLYLRAAELLHRHAYPSEAVAERLVAADQAPTRWSITVLGAAARQALDDGRVTDAIARLRLALRECTDEARRPGLQLDLAAAEWQVDPAVAARHLPELSQGLRDGLLPAEAGARMVTWMLWLGRTDDVLETLRQSSPRIPDWWLRYAYPGLAAPDAAVDHDDERAQLIQQTEEILRQAGLGFQNLTQIMTIAALVGAEELAEAERWCDSLSGSVVRRAPLAGAFVLVLRGLIHNRRGEAAAAAQCIIEAFNLVPERGWGVFVGIPLAELVLALTATGRFDDARLRLHTPLPDALFGSPLVLPHLHARGRYHLAIGRPRDALAEFEACRDLLDSWAFDLPVLVPWRIGLAEAHLALGDRAAARAAAELQLRLLTPDKLRSRGITLRVVAAAGPQDRRIGLLTEAAELLERFGDRLELARVLADLSDHHRLAGQDGTAEPLRRRARALAAATGAARIGSGPAADPAPDADTAIDPLTGLSEAELRVAALAADGFTNRQIARRLHVTMSTVEQHLTRIYRKLEIRRRTELPRVLLDAGRLKIAGGDLVI
jgi:DNA-binding CsgD family transcriptional regulator